MADPAADGVPGHYFDGTRSRAIPATLRLGSGGDVLILAENGGVLDRAAREACRLSERLGNLPRHLDLPGGRRFETDARAALEQVFDARGGLVHWLESRYRYVLVAVLIVVASGAWTVMIGIPMFAKWVAFQLPADTYRDVGDYSLEYLDKYLFEPSELPAARRAALQARFQPYLDDHSRPDLNLRVHFRRMGSANAMALPSGDLVFTDEIVELARHDDELVAVLAHEIGHVARRHAVRRSLQAGILAVTVAMFTGDASGLSELLTGVPLVLMELGYSRDMEREADDFAWRVLREHGIPARRFSDLMARLSDEPSCDKSPGGCTHIAWRKYLSSHPGMSERLQRFSDSRAGASE